MAIGKDMWEHGAVLRRPIQKRCKKMGWTDDINRLTDVGLKVAREVARRRQRSN